jgi:hypothetical protein
MRIFRHGMSQEAHDEAMLKLAVSLKSMEMAKLLLALQHKLNRIHSVVRAYPEARLALDIALERLKIENEASRSFARLTSQTVPDFGTPEYETFFENLSECMR